MPEYILNTYNKDSIVPKLVLLISKMFNDYDQEDSTLLSDMIYYGKSYVFVNYIIKNLSYNKLFGYNKPQIAYLKKNKTYIWEYLINNQFLYNKVKEIKSQFVDEAPFTFEFGKESPGKIGRWFGKEIVESYLKNNKKIDLKKLMSTKDAQLIFINSKYSP